MSPLKPLPYSEQFRKRGHIVLTSLSETTHGLGIRRRTGTIAAAFPAQPVTSPIVIIITNGTIMTKAVI